MKVVLFCGGQGFAVPGQSDVTPKPMTLIGYRPVLWHVMRYYAHFGLKEFLLCLGYKGEMIKNYFLKYSEALSNDFIMSQGGRHIELIKSDIQDWDITFLNTGLNTSVGERLFRMRAHLQDEEIFCANYGDNLTDAPLLELVADFRSRNKVAALVSVRPRYSFHVVAHQPDGLVSAISDLDSSDLWVNGGYFLFRRDIFDYLRQGEDLVGEPFQRLIASGQLIAYRYNGFWGALDTLRDLQDLQSLHDSGRPPWAIWLAEAV